MQEKLVQLARNGDHDAFSVLVMPEIARLYGLAGLVLGDRQVAQDAVQEALLRAWRDLPSLRRPDRFQAWLRALLIRACRDEGRRMRRRVGEISLAQEPEPVAAEALDGILQRDELARAFGRLSRDERAVIALRYYDDLATKDAAAALGMRHGTYRSKLHRALKNLAAGMAADARTVRPQGLERSA